MQGALPHLAIILASATVSLTGASFSGSAFPATLALQIRQLEPQGFKLDGVVTVIDCVNFRGYEDASPSAKVGIFLA